VHSILGTPKDTAAFSSQLWGRGVTSSQPRPRRRRFEAFTTGAKIIRLISRRVAIFPAAAAAQQFFGGIATRLI